MSSVKLIFLRSAVALWLVALSGSCFDWSLAWFFFFDWTWFFCFCLSLIYLPTTCSTSFALISLCDCLYYFVADWVALAVIVPLSWLVRYCSLIGSLWHCSLFLCFLDLYPLIIVLWCSLLLYYIILSVLLFTIDFVHVLALSFFLCMFLIRAIMIKLWLFCWRG